MGSPAIGKVAAAVIALGVVAIVLTLLSNNVPDLVNGFLDGLQVGAE